MYIDFYDQHCQTLCELIQMAKKHQCNIKFGFRSDSRAEIDEDILFNNGFTETLRREFFDNVEVNSEHYSNECLWFELYDTRDKTYHTLEYIDSNTFFYFDKDYSDDDLSEELIELIDELEYEGMGFINIRDNKTRIFGFAEASKNDWVETNEVYRSGMALKFFGDYVCDYLGEERIVRVY